MGQKFFVRRYLLVGALMGAGLAVAFLAAMPRLDLPAPTATAETAESFFIRLPEDGVMVTHAGHFPLPVFPPDIPLFPEPALSNSLALLMTVRDAGGEVVGFASELEQFPPDANLAEDYTWPTVWTLMIPGRGSIFFYQIEHSGELGPKVIIPTLTSGENWQGDWTVTTTVGPLTGQRGGVIGGSGEFAGKTGSFQEIAHLTGYSAAGGLLGDVELRIEWGDGE